MFFPPESLPHKSWSHSLANNPELHLHSTSDWNSLASGGFWTMPTYPRNCAKRHNPRRLMWKTSPLLPHPS